MPWKMLPGQEGRRGGGVGEDLRVAMRDLDIVKEVKKAVPGSQAFPLGKIFRRKTRELMVEDKIQELIRARVVAELTGAPDCDGKPTQVRVTPVLLKIAGGQYYMKKEEGPQFTVPQIHLHLEKLSDKELEDYVLRGVPPKGFLPAVSVPTQQEEG